MITNLLLFPFPDWISPEIIDYVSALASFHAHSAARRVAEEVDTEDDLYYDGADPKQCHKRHPLRHCGDVMFVEHV